MNARRWQKNLREEWLLVLFVALAIALAIWDPSSPHSYLRWVQWPTLAGLLGLLIAIQGIRDSGLVQHAAAALVARTHSVRKLGLLLVMISALLSMLLTNDVSLFLTIPLTLAIGSNSNLPTGRMVVLQALAVNAGSTLSPIGNPQNLLLWQHSSVSLLQFISAMLPAAATMLLLVAALAWWWLPSERVALTSGRIARQSILPRRGAWSIMALAAMVIFLEQGQAGWGAALLVLCYMLFDRSSVLRIDWLLLLTFAAIFLGLGHLAEVPLMQQALSRLNFDQPMTLYLSGIVASQGISNVPATVLLLDRTTDMIALAVAVNVGGFGVVTGSLANLIALRLARQPHGLRLFHLVSIPFLLVCAPVVYLVWRATAG